MTVGKRPQGINQTVIAFPGPFTEYKIVVVAITTRHDGNASTPILQRTDIAAPSPPTITNLACQKDGTILLRWKRPLVFYNTIDFYIVSYKSSKMDYYRQFQINASSDHIETEVMRTKVEENSFLLIGIPCKFLPQLRIPNLTMNEVYEVKVQAASLSIFNPPKLQIGESMTPKTVSRPTTIIVHFSHEFLFSL